MHRPREGCNLLQMLEMCASVFSEQTREGTSREEMLLMLQDAAS